MASGTILSHIPKLRNSWIIHAATDPVPAPDCCPLLEDRQCSVVGGDCICSWTAHYAVPYLALLRHRKKYENMIYSSGLGPSWTKLDQAGTRNTNVIRERDISTATAAPPAILLIFCTFLVVDFCSLGIGVNYKFLLHFVYKPNQYCGQKM